MYSKTAYLATPGKGRPSKETQGQPGQDEECPNKVAAVTEDVFPNQAIPGLPILFIQESDLNYQKSDLICRIAETNQHLTNIIILNRQKK